MVLSVTTAGLGTAAKATGAMYKRFAWKLVSALTKAGGTVFLFNFIEDNIEQGINKNFAGLQTVLDQVMRSRRFEEEIQKFRTNSETLRSVSYGKTQAQDHLFRLLGTIERVGGGKSLFDVRLENTMQRIQNRLLSGMIKNVAKGTLPVNHYSAGVMGSFGSNGKVIMRCSDQIQEFVLTTMEGFNGSILKKIERIEAERDLTFHGDEKPPQADFQGTVDSVITKMKAKLRIRIADHIYEYLTGNKAKQRMYDTITAGYSAVLNNNRLSMTEIIDDGDSVGMKEDSEEEDLNTNR